MAKTKRPVLSERDIQVLLFLWRHRLSTFRALREIFYPQRSAETAYSRMKKLRRAGYVRTDFMDGTGAKVWCLNERGFRLLEANHLPNLKTGAYKPQSKYHDLRVLAALLGDWYVQLPKGVRILSEQDIIALEHDELPPEIVDAKDHVPDGVWIFEKGRERQGVALEVETTAKSTARYERICSLYASRHFISNVVWIVASRRIAERILKAAGSGSFASNQHLFILLSDFEKRGWLAEFLNVSRKGISLRSFLESQLDSTSSTPTHALGQRPSTTRSAPVPRGATNPFFEFNVFPKNSRSCSQPAGGSNP